MTIAAVESPEILDLIRRHQSAGRAFLYAIAGANDVEVSAAGSWVTGASGRRYLDFGSYAVNLLGHGHPHVVAAVEEQLRRLPGSSRAFPSDVNARAAEAIAGIAPTGLTKVMLLNSGAETVEAAIKLSRAATGRTPVCHLEGSFHGKTLGALSLTDAACLREPFRPLLAEVVRLSRSHSRAAANVIRGLRPAAVFVEPIQGEGGVFELGAEYLRELRLACDDAGALLVFDEVQCGLGRCGSLWAGAEAGVVPDILLAGKALGGGVMPVSALIATPAAFAPFDRDPLLHTSTFGGNPLASAAALAVVEVVTGDAVPEKARRLGRALRPILEDLIDAWPALFAAVSGRGLLLGLHCLRAEVAGLFIRNALAEGLLLTPCLTSPAVCRLTPSAYVSDGELAFAGAALTAAARATQRELEG